MAAASGLRLMAVKSMILRLKTVWRVRISAMGGGFPNEPYLCRARHWLGSMNAPCRIPIFASCARRSVPA